MKTPLPPVALSPFRLADVTFRHCPHKVGLVASALLLLGAAICSGDTFNWGFNASGNWSDSSESAGWNASGAYPSAAGDIANLSLNITAATMVSIDVSNATVGSLNLNDTGSTGDVAWTISTTDAVNNVLTFAAASGNASLTSAGATNVISAPVALSSSLGITTTNGLTMSGVISGSGGITKSGSSALTLSGTTANTYSGLTTVTAGTVNLSKTSGQNSIGGNLTINGGSVTYNASNQIANAATVTISGGTLNFNNGFSETITNLTMSGGSVAMATTANNNNLTVSGTTSMSGGAITIGGAVHTLSAGVLNMSGGTITTSATSNGSNTINANGLTITNIASGSYTPIMLRKGASTSNRSSLVLSGDLSFSGFSGNSNSVTIDDVNPGGTGVNAIRLSAGTHTFTVNDGDAAVDLVIKPRLENSTTAAGLVKSGDGVLELRGNNTYTGTTTVNAGTLLINGTHSSAVTVANGGTLGGSGTISGATTIQSGAGLSPGNSPGIATFSGGLTLATGSTFTFELVANSSVGRGTTFDGVNVTGGTFNLQSGVTADLIFNLAGSTVDWSDSFWDSNQQWLVFANTNVPSLEPGLFGTINMTVDGQGDALSAIRPGTGFTFSQVGNDIYLNFTAVPEPSAVGLLGFGVVGLMLVLRRRRLVAH